MISEIERSISGFITRLHTVSGRFSLMTDHSEVIDAALPLFSKIDKLVSMLELLPETTLDESETVCVSNVVSTKTPAESAAVIQTPPRPRAKRGRKRKATAGTSTNPVPEEHIPELDSSEQLTPIIKTEPESFSDTGVEMECNSVDEHDFKVDKADPEDDDDYYGDQDDYAGNDEEGSNEEDEEEVDEAILDDVSKSDLDGNALSETLKLLKKKGSLSTGREGQWDLSTATSSGLEGTTSFVAKSQNVDGRACTMCSKEFQTRSGMKDHMALIHEGECRYTCTSCSRRFQGKSAFRSHLFQHMDIKQYKCDECGKEFVHRKNLTLHKVTIHVGTRIPCDACGKEYMSMSNLKRHKRSVHEGARPECLVCKTRFHDQHTLRRHIRSYHAPK